MTLPFFKRLEDRVRTANSLLCVGLDPHRQYLRKEKVSEVREFCLRLIEETAEFACAFKPNSAFFESFGAEGWRVLEEVIRAVPDGIPVILDAKRGDIASTAKAYAQGAYAGLGADAMTLNPYLGWDSIEAMLAHEGSGAFLLCKTSNPGSDDFQGQVLESGEPLYVHVARSLENRGLTDNVGVVVGATDSEALALVRSILPNTWILAPGVGPQGGDLETALSSALRPDGMGMILPLSRAIAEAEDRRSVAVSMRDRINEFRNRPGFQVAEPVSLASEYLADYLLQVGCVKFGEFTLKSGLKSPIYFDLRLPASYPKLLSIAAKAYGSLMEELEFDRIAAIPLAALPIGATISIQRGIPMIYPRKEVKNYGTQASVEGQYEANATVLVIDDLVSSGESKFEAINQLTSAGLVVRDIVVLIDREGGGESTLADAGYRLLSVFKLSELIDHWERTEKITREQAKEVRKFIKSG